MLSLVLSLLAVLTLLKGHQALDALISPYFPFIEKINYGEEKDSPRQKVTIDCRSVILSVVCEKNIFNLFFTLSQWKITFLLKIMLIYNEPLLEDNFH